MDEAGELIAAAEEVGLAGLFLGWRIDPGMRYRNVARVMAVYIRVERIIKFSEAPGCKACLGKGLKLTDACRERFAKLLKEQREELAARSAPGGTEVIAETPLPPMPPAPHMTAARGAV